MGMSYLSFLHYFVSLQAINYMEAKMVGEITSALSSTLFALEKFTLQQVQPNEDSDKFAKPISNSLFHHFFCRSGNILFESTLKHKSDHSIA